MPSLNYVYKNSTAVKLLFMSKFIFLFLMLASHVFASDFYSRVYVAKNDTSIGAIFEEIKTPLHEREEILRLNPQLERLDVIPAGTIINLSLYRSKNTVAHSLKKIKMEKNREEKNGLTFSPLFALKNFKTGLNNDSEISTSARAYGIGVSFEIPQNPSFSLGLYSQLMNVEFTNVRIKQQTGNDKMAGPDENQINYDLGIKGTFNKTNYFNSFGLSLSRKVDHQYYFSKSKNFFTNNIEAYTEVSRFSGWWLGAEFNQSLPFYRLPLEAGLTYGFILDGDITSEESSSVRSLNGSQAGVSVNWKLSDTKSFGVTYQSFSYRSEYSSDGSSVGLFGNFKI